MDDPDGRVLVLDYPTRQSGTIVPVFRYLIDQAIMHGMDDPGRSVYYLLGEIEHLDATIKRLGKLINVGRGVNCQSIISPQVCWISILQWLGASATRPPDAFYRLELRRRA
ncbi:hypothetical protein [Halalkalicoccus tibetensis]|uniref:Uncharacterized protein n=1 Tax=Halalkalicoccus tibetensis TaxID=175632 RepID=A0ABD5V5X0_9EURY